MNNLSPVLQCTSLSKSYVDGKGTIDVLKNIDFTLAKGDCVSIVGASGSGKSTLLHLLGGLDKPTQGDVFIHGKNIFNLGTKELSRLRNECLGFIYQFHHLLPEFTALENVCMPLLIKRSKIHVAKEKAKAILAKIGLEKRFHHKVGEMSGGERQRTAIARALVTEPLCVLADEPTGNLDHQTAEQVFEEMMLLNKDLGTSLIIVTHDLNLANRMDRVLKLEDGLLG